MRVDISRDLRFPRYIVNIKTSKEAVKQRQYGWATSITVILHRSSTVVLLLYESTKNSIAAIHIFKKNMTAIISASLKVCMEMSITFSFLKFVQFMFEKVQKIHKKRDVFPRGIF